MSNRAIVEHHRALIERMREENRRAVDPQLEDLVDAHEELLDAYRAEKSIPLRAALLRELQDSTAAMWLRVEAIFGPA